MGSLAPGPKKLVHQNNNNKQIAFLDFRIESSCDGKLNIFIKWVFRPRDKASIPEIVMKLTPNVPRNGLFSKSKGEALVDQNISILLPRIIPHDQI